MYLMSQDAILSEIEPLTVELLDVFDDSVARADEFMSTNTTLTGDGYTRSTMTRIFAKEALAQLGYELARIANMGIEVRFLGKYSVKIVRSDHRGSVPAPKTLSRAAWCCVGQSRLTADGIDPEVFWDVERLRLRGTSIEGAVLRAFGSQGDGLIHLIVDWQEDEATGIVRMAVSQPVGAWSEREAPRVAWRSTLERDEEGSAVFKPSNESINIFLDDSGEGEEIAGIGVSVV